MAYTNIKLLTTRYRYLTVGRSFSDTSDDLWNDCFMTNDELVAASQVYDISVDNYTGTGPTAVNNGSSSTSSTDLCCCV